MADLRGLEALDPYELQDIECKRLADWLGRLDDVAWELPSGCEGWSRRDLLAHLVATEEYFTACLDGTVAELVKGYFEAGADSLDAFNAAGVAAASGIPAAELLVKWLELNEKNRAGFRAADGTDIDSSIGTYPARMQAFHVAFEYAIHANDLAAPVTQAEGKGRQRWLAGVARFALTEIKDDVSTEVDGDSVIVRRGDTEVEFSVDNFVAGVSGRAPEGLLTTDEAQLLSLGY